MHIENTQALQICLASNQNYFKGLYTTIGSMLLANSDVRMDIHIIDGGIEERSFSKLLHHAKRLNPSSNIHRHRFDEAVFAGFIRDSGGSHMTYARILIGSLLSIDRVIYLDADLVVLSDLRDLWTADLDGAVLAAAPCPITKKLIVDCPWPIEDNLHDSAYFNAGLLLIDLKLWRKKAIETEVLDLIKKDPSRCKCWDQTALNYILRGQICWLTDRWNREASSQFDFSNDQVVIHYMAPSKPWTVFKDVPSYVAWRHMYSRFGGSRLALYSSPRFVRSCWWYYRLVLAQKNAVARVIFVEMLKFWRQLLRSDIKKRILDRNMEELVSTSLHRPTSSGAARDTWKTLKERYSN